ncbi:MAG TPA: exonuclease SbcCD subunit D [Anaerolineae bacterium]|nr:exonuclease SbcCD subunit D [Anaerolineae bacterium]HID84037.1 exonuclease SbcCD subunit D [Anaerolineales bacterium]HIQ08026.1 exonuclease SbcCD subunit D [Anaerolineaceae bacterium]
MTPQPRSLRLLHFADAHIDIAAHGRHDPETGLPVRVMDFLRSLDVIVETAIEEQVDLVLFAGDAFRDRRPAPTYLREWARRILRLSAARIPTLLLVGNHDYTPAVGRAHALDPFATFQVPYVRVLDRPALLGPKDLWGLPLQVLALPWISRARLALLANQLTPERLQELLEHNLTPLVEEFIRQAQAAHPDLPLVLTAHASVQGASYGAERLVMMGDDLVLPPALVKRPAFAYVALGHIHKPQDLNANSQPPVIYPGSIERVDFGEAEDQKAFVIATLTPGAPTRVDWRRLPTRPFIEKRVQLSQAEEVMEQLLAALGPPESLKDAVVRLVVTYPRELERLIDDARLYAHARQTLEFHLVKRPEHRARARLPQDETLESLTPEDLLEIYWKAQHRDAEQIARLKRLAQEIIQSARDAGKEAA